MTQHFGRFLRRGVLPSIVTLACIVLPAHADFNVSPEVIAIAGNRTDQISTTLTLSAREGGSTLQTAVSDLRRADGGAFIPAKKVVIQPPREPVSEGSPTQITITVNLADASANGEFLGSLYLYQQGRRQVLPLTVRVKAAPLWPWVVMIGGVLLGTGLSLYRSEGRSRDEIIVQVGRLRTQMRGDIDLNKDFQIGIESELVDVESAIEDKDWETAKTEIMAAKLLWNRWRKGREDWIAQLCDGQTLIDGHFVTLPDSIQSSFYMQGVKDQIDAIYRKLRMGQYETPQTLNDEFTKVRRMLSQYQEGEALVGNLRHLRASASLPREQEQHWLEQLDSLEGQLKCLPPDDVSSFQAWKSELDKMQSALEQAIAQSAAPEPTRSVSKGITGRSAREFSPLKRLLPPGPAISSVFHPERVAKAGQNLKWFNWTSRVIAITLLAWLGMTELYGSNATFGADPLRDYFVLLAWGFGAELTRESVLRATQDLGLPLTK